MLTEITSLLPLIADVATGIKERRKEKALEATDTLSSSTRCTRYDLEKFMRDYVYGQTMDETRDILLIRALDSTKSLWSTIDRLTRYGRFYERFPAEAEFHREVKYKGAHRPHYRKMNLEIAAREIDDNLFHINAMLSHIKKKYQISMDRNEGIDLLTGSLDFIVRETKILLLKMLT
tara:strand:+ start:139 stop:669 length:531 start_codon:yes stop_codon:yes gene_type:complete